MLKLEIRSQRRWVTVQPVRLPAKNLAQVRTKITPEMRSEAIKLCEIMSTGHYGKRFGDCCRAYGLEPGAKNGAAELARQALWQYGQRVQHSSEVNVWTRAALYLKAEHVPEDEDSRDVYWRP